jgi:hypothetical protein
MQSDPVWGMQIDEKYNEVLDIDKDQRKKV